ncbi:TrpB-like pyridoxal-phosphate dependent enzyme [Candidatus Gottesmanbacteria bacterium RIFCSPHIGHO2_02_FULL_40_24]|uniref:Tryptophan synthase beta chain n=1 Tax=Candidatus Gottesmanbacteria bacterium RIFCSPHIGHO2_01_FULL_40_15 TaxID=1798376 RepID=A0A1F5Z3Y2_9BACT|nr:MAG: TrpB-like pyridoxal-phosphate dependent enzyme [Candidatus Gottesmanbacteria bacterium RIFCSPHIGHO2_01_FULL_40_15]OGG18655.1 MAG: TrpB-like pyridoxal-phosphate dependent enzyme [Candidatus Gottesmanbacteria bacterium RIFCSPHIGHO2_02_FULL_40_24]OGG22947.1 MAG: TrpB-like pyridoxal-phosphate dependent enzyme [Candidatus Gottesmanbacteria bacterium RIFCSPHIGHO2_12_FULL_40_13]OGG31867.1 MAG: TrpB-like pyridoxal-phosphate dependent enzyme [Candidatus Gottesmanbacteria bacterium RIFCSPLOWO2_02_
MRAKIILEENELPENFININYYLKKFLGKLPDPPLNPETHKPVGAADLEAIFAKELIKQEATLKEVVGIPEEVRKKMSGYRPTPLFRAGSLEKILDTPAHIYYKYEGASPVGSHKMNTALVQAYYNRKQGIKTLITETGAGQWGSALSLACFYFGLKCLVFMVRISYDQKPYRKTVMNIYGAEVRPSPSATTEYGKLLLKDNKNHAGSLGIAISEALESVVKGREARYSLGSVLNHVLLHQTVIGQEAKKQMEKTGEYPDIIIGCCGGGSNFAGIAFPFLADGLKGERENTKFIAVEPESCPSLTHGAYRYDFGDSAQMTPLLKMKTLGSDFIPSPIHAGGLRYHGVAPQVAFLHEEGLIDSKTYGQPEVFKAAIIFARSEGIIPAPESAHAIKAAIDEAIRARDEGRKKVILFNLSGHGLLDLGGYEGYLAGHLK